MKSVMRTIVRRLKNMLTGGKPELKQFLKVGYVYNRHLNPTKSGTPQGEFCEVCR